MNERQTFDLEAFRDERDAARKAKRPWQPSAEEVCAAYAAGERDFGGADLSGAVLRGADLRMADLRGADLRGANLSGADLIRADLSGAVLRGADLRGANLDGTCLDPAAVMPTTDISALGEVDAEGYVTCYRTYQSQHVGDTTYTPGQSYTAPVFSVDVDTVCHPGIYVASREWLAREYPGTRLVQVRVKASDVLRAGDKFRCRGPVQVLALVDDEEGQE